jgi:hypothetical protein
VDVAWRGISLLSEFGGEDGAERADKQNMKDVLKCVLFVRYRDDRGIVMGIETRHFEDGKGEMSFKRCKALTVEVEVEMGSVESPMNGEIQGLDLACQTFDQIVGLPLWRRT